MKILKLEFANINSLEGRYSIDFTHPSLANAGLFSISGPTGSGKTSILDALCFGLYNMTPRQNENNAAISSMRNEIMTRGTDFCYARVTFRAGDGKTYAASTTQKRSQRSTIQPFRQACRLLEVIDDNGQARLVDNNARTVTDKVVALSGLTYRNAMRCMVLAQGEFAAFLRAKGSERAEVLSTITGTEIYRRIGEEVYRRCTSLEQSVRQHTEQLREVLSEEERARKSAEYSTLLSKETESEQALKVCEQTLRRSADIENAKADYSRVESYTRKAETELRAFSEGGRAKLLQLGRRAKEVKPALERLQSERAATRKLQAEYDSLTQQLRDIMPRIEEADKELQTVRQQNEREFPLLERQMQLVQNQLLPLEKELALATEREKAAGLLCKKARRIEEETTEELNKKRQALQAAASAAAPLPTKAQTDAREAALTAQQRELTDNLSLEQFARRRVALNRLLSADQENRGAKEQNARAARALQTARRELADLPRPEEQEKRLRSCEKILQHLTQIKGLAPQLADLYELFKNKELECCPCCGSLSPGEKPLHVHDEEIEQAKQQVSDAQAAYRKARSIYETAENKLHRAAGAFETTAENVKKNAAVLAEALRAVGMQKPPQDINRIIQQTEQAATRLEQIRNEISALREQKRHLAAYETALLADKQARLNTANAVEELHAAEKITAETRNKRSALWDKNETGSTALRRLMERANALRTRLSNTERNFTENTHAAHTLRVQLAKVTAEKTTAQKRLEAAQTEFTRIAEENGLPDEAEAFAAQAAISQVGALTQQEQDLKERVLLAQAERDSCRRRLEALKAQHTDDRTPEQLTQQAASLRERLQTVRDALINISVELRKDEEVRALNQGHLRISEQLSEELDEWHLLSDVLGTTKNQDGFRRYAQMLTFGVLLRAANERLRHMESRYSLRAKKNEVLGLEVIDHFTDDVEGRDVSNLSGGESFIVSLALALGLSQLSGARTNIDSLFLDEGFGTLDEASLENVLGNLESLQSEGKLIGIISHVQALHERMPDGACIRLERIAGGDRSRLLFHPAVTCG